jgi:hypothetical protein
MNLGLPLPENWSEKDYPDKDLTNLTFYTTNPGYVRIAESFRRGLHCGLNWLNKMYNVIKIVHNGPARFDDVNAACPCCGTDRLERSISSEDCGVHKLKLPSLSEYFPWKSINRSLTTTW